MLKKPGNIWSCMRLKAALINGFHALLGNKNTSPTEVERFPLLAAYELCLKCSHLFNILDARAAISVTERVGVIARIRQLAVGLAKPILPSRTRP